MKIEYSSTTDHDIQKQIWKLLGKQVIIKLRRATSSSSCIPPKIVLLHISKGSLQKSVSVHSATWKQKETAICTSMPTNACLIYKYHMHVSHPMLFNATNNATIMYTSHVAYIRMKSVRLIFFTKPNYPVFLFSKPTPTILVENRLVWFVSFGRFPHNCY